jgi:hypothetical protein
MTAQAHVTARYFYCGNGSSLVFGGYPIGGPELSLDDAP